MPDSNQMFGKSSGDTPDFFNWLDHKRHFVTHYNFPCNFIGCYIFFYLTIHYYYVGIWFFSKKVTYSALIRPVLEYSIQIYHVAVDSNLEKLERVQPGAERDITDLRNYCPSDIVQYESDLQPLRLCYRFDIFESDFAIILSSELKERRLSFWKRLPA